MTTPTPTYPIPPAGFALKSRAAPEIPPRKPSIPLLPPLPSPPAPTHSLATSSSSSTTSPLSTSTTLTPLPSASATTSSPIAQTPTQSTTSPMIISPTTSTSTSTPPSISASPFSSFFSPPPPPPPAFSSPSEPLSASSSMSDISMSSNPIPITQSASTPSVATTIQSQIQSQVQSQVTSQIQPLDLSTYDTLSSPSITELSLIRVSETAAQRVQHDNMADLFSIIVALERLETAFVRDAIPSTDYKQACAKLLAQYRTLKDAVSDVVPDVFQFMQDYNMQCRAAAARIQAATPADLGDHGASEGKELSVFHAVQHFITTMDSLKLNMKAVDELFPHLTDLMDSINKVSNLPPDHDSKVKVKHWLSLLSKLRAHDELSEEQVRQMSFDLDYAYSAFHKFVQGK